MIKKRNTFNRFISLMMVLLMIIALVPSEIFKSASYNTPEGGSKNQKANQKIFRDVRIIPLTMLEHREIDKWLIQIAPGSPYVGGYWYEYYFYGDVAYCVEPANGNSSSGTEYYPYGYDGIDSWQKDLVAKAMSYGYPYNSSNIMAQMGTQVLIWEICFGYVDKNLNLLGFNGVSPMLFDQYPSLQGWYDRVKNDVLKYNNIPSFSQLLATNALTYSVADGKVVLTDTQGVLDKYDIVSAPTGVSFSKSGNVLTLTATNENSLVGEYRMKNTRLKGLTYWVSSSEKPEQRKATLNTTNTGKDAYFKVKLPDPGTLIIQKADNVSNKLLPNATFQVKRGTTVVRTVTTGADGKVTVPNLPVGTYQVVETVAPKGYFLNTTPITATITENGNHTITFKNIPTSEIIIKKYDTITNALLNGITFNVKKADGTNIGNYKTVSGTINIPNLAAGTYVITETATIPTHVLNTTPKSVTITAGQILTVDIKNNPYPKLEVLKVNKQTNAPVQGVIFRLYQSDGKTKIADYTTNSSGKILIENTLLAGNYFLQEIKTPVNIVLDDTIHPIKLEWGKTTKVDIKNNEYPLIEIFKSE